MENIIHLTITRLLLHGYKNLPTICEDLRQAGKKEDTPVAVIEWGTTGKQRVVTGTLSTIVSIVKMKIFLTLL